MTFLAEYKVNKFDNIYSGNRPKFLDGYKKLKDVIKPWGA